MFEFEIGDFFNIYIYYQVRKSCKIYEITTYFYCVYCQHFSSIFSSSGVNPCGRRDAVSHQWSAAAERPACPWFPQPSPLQTPGPSPFWCKSSRSIVLNSPLAFIFYRSLVTQVTLVSLKPVETFFPMVYLNWFEQLCLILDEKLLFTFFVKLVRNVVIKWKKNTILDYIITLSIMFRDSRSILALCYLVQCIHVTVPASNKPIFKKDKNKTLEI